MVKGSGLYRTSTKYVSFDVFLFSFITRSLGRQALYCCCSLPAKTHKVKIVPVLYYTQELVFVVVSGRIKKSSLSLSVSTGRKRKKKKQNKRERQRKREMLKLTVKHMFNTFSLSLLDDRGSVWQPVHYVLFNRQHRPPQVWPCDSCHHLSIIIPTNKHTHTEEENTKHQTNVNQQTNERTQQQEEEPKNTQKISRCRCRCR